jgi:hypothetical protein
MAFMLRYVIACPIGLYDSKQAVSERTALERTGKVRTKQEQNSH